MARDTHQHVGLQDLTDEEIERVEGALFCMGGPPPSIGGALLVRATTGAAPDGRARAK